MFFLFHSGTCKYEQYEHGTVALSYIQYIMSYVHIIEEIQTYNKYYLFFCVNKNKQIVRVSVFFNVKFDLL